MSTTVAADVQSEDREVPLWRLHLLRVTYAVFVLPALIMIPFGTGPLPRLIFHAPTERGMISAMLAGLFVMTAIGLRYPLKMLPIFLFEFTWKAIWLLFYGLPQWLAGVRTAQFNLDIIMIGGGPILFGLVIPWTYVFRHYLKAPAERWR